MEQSVFTDKVYGRVALDPVLLALMNTRVLERLCGIHQAGAMYLADERVSHTRFDHSVGVMLLLRRLGASLQEQIAGLLHDISHTAFSHLIDYVLAHQEEDFHEHRYLAVLQDKELVAVLEQYGYQLDQFTSLEQYTMLEYPLPGLCADRIDYTLRDLLQLGHITKPDIDWLLEGLIVYDNRIVCKDRERAMWFQQQYTFLVRDYFNGKVNRRASAAMTGIVRSALEQKHIDLTDFYGDDAMLIQKLKDSMCMDLRGYIQAQIAGEKELPAIRSKRRVLDPEVLVNGELVKLSTLKSSPD